MKTTNPTKHVQTLRFLLGIVIVLHSLYALPSHGQTYGGVEFPQGPASFADEVVQYSRGSYAQPPYTTPANALGVPSGPYVSLGNYGTLIVGFTDNALTASGNTNKDLWIFEAGDGTENVDVSISTDGTNWIAVGRIQAHAQGIDIDAFTPVGVVAGALYRYVKLVDVGNDFFTGPYAGADINAVGAISTILDVPDLTIRVSEVELSWASLTNKTYRLDYRSDLTTNIWTSLLCVTGDGTTKRIYDRVPVETPRRFYRLAVTNCVPEL